MTAEPPIGPASAATVATLSSQRRAWEERPLLRRIYRGWFEEVVGRLSDAPGPTVEIGAGCGSFQDFMPEAIGTDVVETPWAETVGDAAALPFESGGVGNLVMIDVLHHLATPAAAMRESERVLAPGGRLVMVEPHCSPLSTFGWRRFHHEHLDLGLDPEAPLGQSSDNPFDANIATPTVIFWRRPELLSHWAPGLTVIERRRMAWLAYPLSGGFSGRRLLPPGLAGAALALDRILAPLASPLAAFRCLIVVEKFSREFGS